MSIGIIGAGISGLHLALRLRQLGIDATLYSARTPEELRGGPPPNLVTRLGSTRIREEVLGVDHWVGAEFENPSMRLSVEAPGGPSFQAALQVPASSVDFRLYLSRLLEDYEQRGGRVVRQAVTDRTQLAELGGRHDLLVVAAGRSALTDAFPRDASRSPYRSPRRHLLGGLFHGVRPPEPVGMTMHMVPGAGEVHAPGYYSFDGQVTAILVEAVPDGPFAEVTDRDYAGDPDAFTAAVLDLITTHAPGLRERVDSREFRLTRPIDVLQGALTPVVRHGWAQVGEDRFALSVGDARIVNDPLTAQGANLGSRQAFELADALLGHQGPYGEKFCRDVSARLWAAAQPVVDWTNTFIGDPPPQMLTLLGAAAADQRVAAAFVANLDRPRDMWNSVRSPEGTEEFIAKALAVRSGV